MGDKQDQVQEHSELVEHLKKTYVDADGTRPTTIAICEAECKSRDLKCKIVDEKVAAMALRNGDRVVMVSFGMDDVQWNNFKQFFKENKEGVLTADALGKDGLHCRARWG